MPKLNLRIRLCDGRVDAISRASESEAALNEIAEVMTRTKLGQKRSSHLGDFIMDGSPIQSLSITEQFRRRLLSDDRSFGQERVVAETSTENFRTAMGNVLG